MTTLCLCLILRLRLSLCLCPGVLTCFSTDYAYAYVMYACAYALVKTSLRRERFKGYDFYNALKSTFEKNQFFASTLH